MEEKDFKNFLIPNTVFQNLKRQCIGNDQNILFAYFFFHLEGSKLSFESLPIFQAQGKKQQKGNSSFKSLPDALLYKSLMSDYQIEGE